MLKIFKKMQIFPTPIFWYYYLLLLVSYQLNIPVENFLMFDNAYKNDQKVHFFVNLYTNICQRNMQRKTVDIIRLILCYSI